MKLSLALLVAGCAHRTPAEPVPAPVAPNGLPTHLGLSVGAQVVASPDRSDADRELDAGRLPAAFLDFLWVEPGMRVADLMAGTGYTTELLARAVAPGGVVYSQNNAFVVERFAEKPWSERLAKPVMADVVRVDRELEAPLPPEATDLDLVVMNLFYHDAVWMNVDRPAMNAAILASLKPGGRFVVVDHAAREGAGVEDVQTLHRIEESVVAEELTAAGFELVRTSDLYRHPEDTRDWNAAPSAAGERRGTSDRFVLEVIRPLQ
ncbi:MAG: class I SAM-dependent methyltransferase [Alphaproteobacteria bacterium]|nr:class I SAM-dependent methyltransferase [Alphaproteobacteria bacterium]